MGLPTLLLFGVHIFVVFLVTLTTSLFVVRRKSRNSPLFTLSVPYPPRSLGPRTITWESRLPIVIPALTSIRGPDDTDYFLYSVMSALLPAAYQTTSSYLGATLRQRVWSFRPRHRWSTISLGMGLTFRQAYRSLDLQLPMDPIKAHEVRAVSDSLALVRGVSLSRILKAAFWKAPATFIHYYLRDVRAHRQDGSYGISSMVLAQAATA